MAFSTLFEGVIFIEGENDKARKVANIDCDLSKKIGAQLKNLNDVKRFLASKARDNNCNSVVNFAYGQKSKWRFVFDDVGFHGSGIAAVLPSDEYDKLVEKIESR